MRKQSRLPNGHSPSAGRRSAPTTRTWRPTLNNLAQLYRAQGDYARAESALAARARDLREGARPGPPGRRHFAQQPRGAVRWRRATTRGPSRSTGARSPSTRRRSAPTTRTSPRRSTTSRGSTRRRATTRGPSRSTGARSPSIEKALGPDHPDVASSLNNLAELYQATGRLRAGRAALPARARDLREGARPRAPRRSPSRSTTSQSCTGRRATTRRPSRSSSAPSPSTRRRSAPTTRTSPSRSTTSRAVHGEGRLRAGRAALPARARHLGEGARPGPPGGRHLAQQPGAAVRGEGRLCARGAVPVARQRGARAQPRAHPRRRLRAPEARLPRHPLRRDRRAPSRCTPAPRPPTRRRSDSP